MGIIRTKKYFLIFFMSVPCLGMEYEKTAAAAKKTAKVVIKSIGNDKKGNITVYWKKIPKASKYQVQAGKSYYIRVRAYKTAKGEKSYGK